MKVKYRNKIYRVMFNQEAELKFKNHFQVLFWKDDSIVRLVENENQQYKGVLVKYPFNEEIEII